MLLRSHMHCLSLSDKPNTGSGLGRNGTPPWLLLTNECRKLDNTLCGGPETGCRRKMLRFTVPVSEVPNRHFLEVMTNYQVITGQQSSQLVESRSSGIRICRIHVLAIKN